MNKEPPNLKEIKKEIFRVRGTSIIKHHLRLKLGVTNDEWIFLDFLKHRQDAMTKRITYDEVWTAVGFEPKEVAALWKSLKEKELVYKHETGVVTTTQKFDDIFSFHGRFDEFWKISSRGNKESARRAYSKVIRLVDEDLLHQKYREYIKWCNDTGTFMKHTSSWLNPNLRHWEDKLTNQKVKDEPKSTVTTILETDF